MTPSDAPRNRDGGESPAQRNMSNGNQIQFSVASTFEVITLELWNGLMMRWLKLHGNEVG